MPSQEVNFFAEQNCDNPVELLRSFLDTHHLRLEELAGLLRITPQTLEGWFSEGIAPPAAFLALAVLFDAKRHTSRRVGHGLWPSSPHRAKQDDYMLRMVRAI